MEGISVMNYKQATPVQTAVIPKILQGDDVIACAQTGTGKTAAFLLPIIHKIISAPSDASVKALVIVPTRELAVQIAQQVDGFGYYASVSSLAVYGGGTGPEYANEQHALRNGADIVICTPGRMISHLNMGYVNVKHLQFLVLDEADRMLDMGFYDDIMKIISFLPANRQNLLFSATMPPKIRELSKKILKHPKEINIALSSPPEGINQQAYILYESQKLPLVKYLIRDAGMQRILVFCDTKIMVKQLVRELQKTVGKVEQIHSDLDQSVREQVMNQFKSRQVRVLVATDIVSRGIDVEDIDMVINYNVPQDAEDYIHRIGRTARAASLGAAVTLVGETEQRKLAAIEKLLDKKIPKPNLPEEFEAAPTYRPNLVARGKKSGKQFVRRSNRRYKK